MMRTWNTLPWIVAAALLGGTAILAEEDWKAPESAAKKQNPVEPTDKNVAAAKAIYAKECLSCHGAKGKGDGQAAEALEKKPRNLSVTTKGQSDGELFWKITEGRKPMPAFSKTLSVQDRWTVIHYVRVLAGEKPGAKPADAGGDANKPVAPKYTAPDGYREGLSAVAQRYLKAGAALGREDAAGAQAEAAAIADGVAKLPKAEGEGLDGAARDDWKSARAALEKGSDAFKAAKDLAGEREAFKTLSAALVDGISKFGHAEGAALRAFSEGSVTWIQADASPLNPFTGAKAGKLERLLAPKAGT